MDKFKQIAIRTGKTLALTIAIMLITGVIYAGISSLLHIVGAAGVATGLLFIVLFWLIYAAIERGDEEAEQHDGK